MNNPDCATTRDVLPAFVHRLLAPEEHVRTELHLDACADCREEEAVLRLLALPAEPAPAALHARVLGAIRMRRPRYAPARLAMAATVAAAILGGAVVIERLLPGRPGPQPLATLAQEEHAAPVSWAVELDPLLFGGPAFEQLSVEELEFILTELDR
jgi:hypothetical protein